MSDLQRYIAKGRPTSTQLNRRLRRQLKRFIALAEAYVASAPPETKETDHA